nr:ribonuclease H-like domain-containing protein [Tanacetum cinerariifolium]GEY79064.1 ribonuclease H-like domain-containing protein [Tanacetum cinerariifolium]
MAPRAVLMKTSLRPLITARIANTAHPKTIVYSAGAMSCFSKSGQSTVKRAYQTRTSLTNKNFSQKVNTAKGKIYTARPKAINTARPNSAVVNAVRANQVNAVKASAYFKEFDEGYVTFWGEAKGGKITGKGTLKLNKVLVVMPHNKTPYELFRGRTPAISFMRPFGCHVTILNTLDHLGKFNGKSDDGFFIGYTLNSKAFRVYNIRTRKVKENLHIRFLEDKPFIAGDGPKWLFDIDVLTKSISYVPVVTKTNSNDFVDGSLFDFSSKNASNDEPLPSSDAEKKDNDGCGINDQVRPKNSTQDVNTAGPSINTASTNINTGSLNINIVSLTVTTNPLEATNADFFGAAPLLINKHI